jgi:hypothetical protein
MCVDTEDADGWMEQKHLIEHAVSVKEKDNAHVYVRERLCVYVCVSGRMCVCK